MGEARIGRAVLEITVDDKQYKLGLDGVKAKADDTSKSVSNISSMLAVDKFIEFGKFAAQAIGTVVSTVGELGQRGAMIEDVSGRFGELSQRAGETADTMLGELRAGFANTLSDFDAMKVATSALSVGFIKSKEDMRTLAEGARLLADRTGGSTTEAFDTLTGAMQTGRTAGLKQLGLYVDSKGALEQYAASVNKSTSQLTDQEKAQAMGVATMAKLRGEIESSGPVALDFGDRIDQVKTLFNNFTDGLAVGIARSPVLSAGMDAAGKAIKEAFGPNQETLVDMLVKAVETLAIGAVDGASIIVEAARFIANGFEGAKAGFNALLELLFTGIGKAAGLLQELATKASTLPVIGDGFKSLAGGLQTVKDYADSFAVGFGSMTTQALDNAASLNAGFDKVQGVLGTVKSAMEAAQGSAKAATAETSKAVTTMGAATDDVTSRATENTAKIQEVYNKLADEIVLGTKEGIDKRIAELDISQQLELEKIRQLKELSSVEYDALVLMVNEKYTQLVAAAQLGSDGIRDRMATLQQELLVLQGTGGDQRLLDLQTKQAQEMASIENLRVNYAAQYTALATMITEKYALMTAQVQGHYATVGQAATAAGFRTRAELEQTAVTAQLTYERMKESGLFTAAEILRAHEAAEAAKRAATGTTAQYTLTSAQAVVQGSTQILGILGQRNKTAAIAGAIINTGLAVTKALASAPFPASLVLAAGALAAGMAQVHTIRNTEAGGYKTGTPGLDFANFGRQTQTMLHGEEAVIPRGKGHQLAGEIASAMPGDGDGVMSLLEEIRDGISVLPREVKRAMRDGMLLASA